MKKVMLIALLTFPLLLVGCGSPSYSIRVVDGLPKETFLTFSKDSAPNVGDVFVLYRLQQAPASSGSGHGGHGGHGGGGGGPINLKHEIGKVQVVKIADETHALVKILFGYVEYGVKAEKVN
ncbi:MAG: hypothetical protein HY961_14540 [Ignavibacteriae bacterium]|nr:hypothetical protein [Ignavibacteriota bacterium]